MDVRREGKTLALLATVFLAFYFLPVGAPRFDRAVAEALGLAKWYAREHVLLCLVPAFFIAGGIATFVSSAGVMKYLGPRANKVVALGVASISGTILAVCSCTVLPLFAGIYRRGAGIGPATAFLYSGPAINVLAIILTARVLGPDLGIARAVGAVGFAVIIGLLMHLIFRQEELAKGEEQPTLANAESGRPLAQNVLFFGVMVAILVFANWGKPLGPGLYAAVWRVKWYLTAGAGLALAVILAGWFDVKWWKLALAAVLPVVFVIMLPRPTEAAFAAAAVGLAVAAATSPGETAGWFAATWSFAKQIFPLLLGGVLVAGFFLGRPGEEGILPSAWVAAAVGGNSIAANFFASLAGALMYFATLTEVPIVQGLLGAGMGKGPALALLLAGPALSLPNMLVINSILGPKKTLTFVALVVVMATLTGITYGALA